MTEAENKPPEALSKEPFPRAFWYANITELFERSAYYSVASWVVPYLGMLGLGAYWPSVLSSTVLWGLVYFMPILSGTIADQVGFKKALLVAFVLLAIGYFIEGSPVWFGVGEMRAIVQDEVWANVPTIVMVVVGILLIGFGGSVIKPCVSGTVQKTAGKRATLAFALFYMTINIGSLVGRGTSLVVRTQFDLSYVWAVGSAFCVITFLIVLFKYTDPDDISSGEAAEKKPRKSIGRILADMVLVLKNPRFTFFLIATSGFWFLYNQVYNIMPLYWKRVLETEPAVDVYTMANPFVIVAFQLLITRFFGKLRPVVSIIIGNIVCGVAFAINVLPIFLADSIRGDFWDLVPIGSVVGMATVGIVAFGELFAAPRAYEYVGAMAPKGQEGLFLGYVNLPIAIGAIAGGPFGAAIFNEIMCAGATVRPDGLLDLDPTQNAIGWTMLLGIGLVSATLMFTYHIWLKKQIAKDQLGLAPPAD
jgi:proton-dependent oligopeptide transporter, POT family